MFEGYDLEWSIVTADVATVAGYEARCAFIAGTSFDDDDIINIAFQLGLDAVRPGVDTGFPDCITQVQENSKPSDRAAAG